MKDGGYWQRYWNRKINRRRLLQGTAMGAMGLGAAAVVGCGDDDESPSPTTPSATTPAATATPTPAGPKSGGTILLGRSGTEAATQDPWDEFALAFTSAGPGVAYSRLFKINTGPEVPRLTTEVLGDVAESWEIPEDDTYIVKLRPNVKWHNISPVNGRGLVAEDVVFSFETQMESLKTRSNLGTLKTISATDDLTLRLVSDPVNADLLADLTDAHNKIVAHEAVDVTGDLKEGPTIGTGAWISEEWTPNQIARLRKNPEYFLPGLPYPDELVFPRFSDRSILKAAFRQQKSHVTNTDIRDFEALVQELPDIELVEGFAWLLQRIDVKTTFPPLDDLRVRQAISKAINRQEIIDTVYFGAGFIAPPVSVPGPDWLLPDAEVDDLLGFDPQGARQLLDAAGIDELRIPGFVRNAANVIAEGELIQARLKDVGIIVESLTPLDVQTFIAHFATGDFMGIDIGDLGLATTTSELLAHYRTGGSQAAGHAFSDPVLDEMIDKQSTFVTDEPARRSILLDIQRRILDQAAVIPICFNTRLAAKWNFLKDHTFPTLIWAYEQHDDMWLDL